MAHQIQLFRAHFSLEFATTPFFCLFCAQTSNMLCQSLPFAPCLPEQQCQVCHFSACSINREAKASRENSNHCPCLSLLELKPQEKWSSATRQVFYVVLIYLMSLSLLPAYRIPSLHLLLFPTVHLQQLWWELERQQGYCLKRAFHSF